VDARAAVPALKTPTLIVHGTADTFVPVESSRSAIRTIAAKPKLIEVPGAQHGFAVDNDSQ
jgi:pimeloyl-ACP methyl ester carboxylesterase